MNTLACGQSSQSGYKGPLFQPLAGTEPFHPSKRNNLKPPCNAFRARRHPETNKINKLGGIPRTQNPNKEVHLTISGPSNGQGEGFPATEGIEEEGDAPPVIGGDIAW